MRTNCKHTFIYICAYISSGDFFFMIVVIINIMSWRHTFLANAQYMHNVADKQLTEKEAVEITIFRGLFPPNDFFFALSLSFLILLTIFFLSDSVFPAVFFYVCSHLFNIITTFSKEMGWNVIPIVIYSPEFVSRSIFLCAHSFFCLMLSFYSNNNRS